MRRCSLVYSNGNCKQCGGTGNCPTCNGSGRHPKFPYYKCPTCCRGDNMSGKCPFKIPEKVVK